MEKASVDIMIAVGCNAHHEQQMERARKALADLVADVRYSEVLVTPDCTSAGGGADYANMLARGTTTLTVSELQRRLKVLESELGDSHEARMRGTVMMDMDLMAYGTERHHAADWDRPYIRRLLQGLSRLTVVVVMTLMWLTAMGQQTQGVSADATELLGKGVEYYTAGKYHECILALTKLQKTYRLSPRFMAYLGYSYYQEGDYEEAVKALKPALPSLSSYAPHEQAVYVYATAESLFALQRYKESLDYYAEALPLAQGNNKGDILFHTAFARLMTTAVTGDVAADSPLASYPDMESIDTGTLMDIKALLSEASDIYEEHAAAATALQKQRRQQCRTMMHGIEKILRQEN